MATAWECGDRQRHRRRIAGAFRASHTNVLAPPRAFEQLELMLADVSVNIGFAAWANLRW